MDSFNNKKDQSLVIEVFGESAFFVGGLTIAVIVLFVIAHFGSRYEDTRRTHVTCYDGGALVVDQVFGRSKAPYIDLDTGNQVIIEADTCLFELLEE